MKTHLFILVALAAGIFVATAPAQNPDSPQPPKAKPGLRMGMDRDAVISICGKPTEIQPFGLAEAKAEKWIYRIKTNETTTQVPSGVSKIPAYIGNSGSGSPMIADAAITEYRLKHIVIYQVAALLMVDGKLVTSKLWSEREESFAD